MQCERSIVQPIDWRDQLDQAPGWDGKPLAGEDEKWAAIALEAIRLAECVLKICHIKHHAARAQHSQEQHERF
eukprot:15439044-Alexandrium_andersonii.AAC.1